MGGRRQGAGGRGGSRGEGLGTRPLPMKSRRSHHRLSTRTACTREERELAARAEGRETKVWGIQSTLGSDWQLFPHPMMHSVMGNSQAPLAVHLDGPLFCSLCPYNPEQFFSVLITQTIEQGTGTSRSFLAKLYSCSPKTLPQS